MPAVSVRQQPARGRGRPPAHVPATRCDRRAGRGPRRIATARRSSRPAAVRRGMVPVLERFLVHLQPFPDTMPRVVAALDFRSIGGIGRDRALYQQNT